MKTQPNVIRNKGLRQDNLQAFLMILPFFLGFILFSYVPIIYILRYASDMPEGAVDFEKHRHSVFFQAPG